MCAAAFWSFCSLDNWVCRRLNKSAFPKSSREEIRAWPNFSVANRVRYSQLRVSQLRTTQISSKGHRTLYDLTGRTTQSQAGSYDRSYDWTPHTIRAKLPEPCYWRMSTLPGNAVVTIKLHAYTLFFIVNVNNQAHTWTRMECALAHQVVYICRAEIVVIGWKLRLGLRPVVKINMSNVHNWPCDPVVRLETDKVVTSNFRS